MPCSLKRRLHLEPLFIGGFLVKSTVEERIFEFERDTQRVLAYYKHDDGNERQSRSLVWKYKGKKDALGVVWRQSTEWQSSMRGSNGAKDDDEECEEDEMNGEEL
eukprot:scaffold2180_cov98-Skeletonema_marinoi.AAC.1